MDWIDENLAVYRKARKDFKAIADASDTMLTLLWEQIMEIIEVVAGRGIQLETNGTPRNRIVIMASEGRPPETDRKLHVLLSFDLHRIIGKSDSGETILGIEVGADDIVCLKYQDREVTIQEAARAIMEPFLLSGRSRYSAANVGRKPKTANENSVKSEGEPTAE